MDLSKIRYKVGSEDNSGTVSDPKHINIKTYMNEYNNKKDATVGIPK